MRPKTTLSLLTIAAACAAPAAAHAAPPWSAPQPVAGATASPVLRPALDFGTSSRGILGWSTSTNVTRATVQPTGRLAALTGAQPGDARVIARSDLAAPVRAYARTRTIALLERNAPGARTDASFNAPQRVEVAFGSTDGALGPRHVLAPAVGPRISDADLAVNDRGDAVAVWVEANGLRGFTALNDRLWISVRRAGGAFSQPTVLVGSGRLDAVDAAVGANGDMLVAFTRAPIVRGRETRPRTVAVRYRRAGHRFGKVANVGPNQGFADIDTAIAPNGRAYVAWGTQDLGEEADQPFRVYAAVKPAGPNAFRPGVQLDDGGKGLERPIGNVSIGVAPDAAATVAWSGVRTGRPAGDFKVFFPVLAARTGGGARFGPTQPVAAGNGAVGGVAVSPAGTATVVWTALRPGVFDETTAVLAARRTAGEAAFGPAETVTDQPPGANASPPAVSVDPATGRPVVAFPGRSGLFVSARGG